MMSKKSILLVLAVLALVTLACGISFDLPITTDIKTGPTVVEDILVAAPDSENISEITLAFGAGEIYINPGAEEGLIEGTATYNVDDLKPEISTKENQIEMTTGNLQIEGIPNFDERVENIWDLKFNTDPIDLNVKAGAYQGEFELGGLAIKNLHISDGASDVEVNFTEPNLVRMDALRYETGASNVILRNLSNANFETMVFESGAGNFELDFSGDLQQDSTVLIESGLGSLTISIPEGVSAKVTVSGGLTNISTHGSWSMSGGAYMVSGDGPMLNISVQMSAGNLTLRAP
jgi:hypothetical protein